MSDYGKISSYDKGNGTGMIKPEKGDDMLMFKKDDMKEKGKDPEVGQRFSYDKQKGDNGKPMATKLERQDADSKASGQPKR